MLAEALAAIQGSDIATALRTSLWVYPFVNAAHIVGIAMLFGAILSLDLRLIGFWRTLSIGDLSRVLVPVAVAGLLLAIVTGGLLFSVQAVKYAGMTLFRVKLGLIAGAVLNALLLRPTRSWKTRQNTAYVRVLPRLRVAGYISIVLWLSVIVCGRVLGYL